MVAYPDRGAGNDPKPFFLGGGRGGGGSLSPQRLNIFTVGNMGVMICLGQGGLRSLSASSCHCHSNHVHIWGTLALVALIRPSYLVTDFDFVNND